MNRFLLALLLVSPVFAYAQSVDLRGFGGVMMNSGTYQTAYRYDHSKLNAIGGIGASYRAGHFEYGLNLSYRRYSFQKTIRDSRIDPATGYELAGSVVFREFTLKEHAFAVAPVVNYHFGSGKLDWYAGLSPAYVRFTNVAPTDKNFELSLGIDGFLIDAQVGCSYEFIPRVRGFAEITGGSVWMPYFMAKHQRFFAAGLNLGAQFRLWEAAAAAPKTVAE